MNARTFLLLLSLLSASSPLSAAPSVLRVWKSADGSKSIQAAFVSLDGQTVTMRLPGGQKTSFALDKLSPSDQNEIRALAAKSGSGGGAPVASDGGKFTAFDAFTLGSTIDQTTAAVKTVQGAKSGIAEQLMGRTGLNGIYSIEAGGLSWNYFFGFSALETLTDVSLHGPEVDQASAAKVEEHAARIRPLLTAVAGEPLTASPFVKADKLGEGKIEFAEVYEHGSKFYLLGIGKLDGKVCCVVRCTGEVPKTTAAKGP